MPFVVRTVVIFVDDTERIVELQAVFKPETALWRDEEHPSRCDAAAQSRGDAHALSRLQMDIPGRLKVVSGASRRRADRKFDGKRRFFQMGAVFRQPRFADPFKFCDPFHSSSQSRLRGLMAAPL